MATVALKVSDNFKGTIEKLPWINWSELARQETLKKLEEEHKLKRLKEIVSKSKLTEKDADELANKIKLAMSS